MSLKEEIGKLQNYIIGYTRNPLLVCVNNEFIDILDNNSSDSFLLEIKSKLMNIIKTLNPNIVGNNKWGQFFETYNEGYIYWTLLQKGIAIKHLKEQKNGKKTPDFEIDFNGSKVHMEMKSLGMVDAIIKYKDIQEDALNVAVAMEQQFLAGNRIAIGEQVIQPMKKSGDSSYNPCNVKMVVDEILNKIKQNLKIAQFEYSDTVFLFIDLRLLGSLGKPNEMIKETYDIYSSYSRKIPISVSGVLWHVAFGVETSVLKWASYDDRYSQGSKLMDRNGILSSYPQIKGIIFQVEQLNPKKTEFVGLLRNDEPILKNLFKKICGENVEIKS